jgi:hypothetical protein
MDREKLNNLIKDEIKNALVGRARDIKGQESLASSNSYLQSEEITDDDFDKVLFHGLEEPKESNKTKPFTIRENMENNTKITTTEIKDFESSFKEILTSIQNATIVFNKQKNGYSLLALKKPDGIEAIASGIINLGSNGKITWLYSILNGLTINAQNLKLTESNKIISEQIFNHFTTWQRTWREKLNYPQTEDQPI